MQPEVVSVPTRGVERWVTQQLSGHLGVSAGGDGICANVAFPFPARLVEATLAAAGGDDAGTAWRPERLVWPLLDVVEEAAGEAWLAPLTAHLRSGMEDRRFAAVRRLADLYDRYGVHRPAMLRSWAAGADQDALGRALPADLGWQAELWRRLRRGVGWPSPAERLEDACALVRAAPDRVALPGRLALFGVTRLPSTHAQVLRALGAGREVHLFALHPSPALWQEIAARPQSRGLVRRSRDGTVDAARNPLLASWGRDARELQLILADGTGDDVVDRHHPLVLEPVSLLERIQSAIGANAAPPGPDHDRPPLAPGDDSVSVHACHGRARQVEVLRDAILHRLRADPTLEPRDVIVMCPDIETFAPLIHASFGAADATLDADVDGWSPTDLRVRLADRSLRQTNPVLGVVADLLDLAESRLTASQVLDLASRGPVRARFGLDDEDLDRIETWVGAAGIRWGLDGAHRLPFDLPELDDNTWHAGLSRLLLGAAMSEDGLPLFGGVLPLDDVDSGDLDLAGRLAELVERLGRSLDALAGPQRVADWADALAASARALTSVGEADSGQAAELRRLLDEVVDESSAGDTGRQLTLAEVRSLLLDRLRGRPTRANFRTGHLTVCTLVPMRSVPHRVVCLLGIDDGAFPRRSDPSGDDLIERAPCVGDRDARSEDRQLFLDAVLAATDALVVTYQGRDERTNARRPPAVPLGELLDAVDATVRTEDLDSAGRPVPARHRVVVHHPLQPFDPRNYTAGGCGRPGPWSFDPVNLGGARALAGSRTERPPFLPASLPALRPGPIELDDLVRFVRHPVQAFLRQRLGVGRPSGADETADTLPIELDALARWGVGDRMLRARLAGVSELDACRAERARGSLPPGDLGDGVLSAVVPVVAQLLDLAGRLGLAGGTPRALDVNVELPGGWSVVGTVGGVHGTTVATVTFSGIRSRQRLEAWARLLALAASRPDVAWTALAVGQQRGAAEAVRIGPLPAGPPALAHLEALVDLYRRGLTEALPLYCETSAAWARARARRRDPARDARDRWETPSDPNAFEHEDRDPDHVLVLGRGVSFDQLLTTTPAPDEHGDGWSADEDSRFGRYARRLWDGLLSFEQAVGG